MNATDTLTLAMHKQENATAVGMLHLDLIVRCVSKATTEIQPLRSTSRVENVLARILKLVDIHLQTGMGCCWVGWGVLEGVVVGVIVDVVVGVIVGLLVGLMLGFSFKLLLGFLMGLLME